MSRHLQRGIMLWEQDRNEMAEQEFRAACAEQPEDSLGHAFLALCLSDQDRHDEAVEEARIAVGIDPDDPFTHYALAKVSWQADQLDAAESAARESIRCEAENAAAWEILAGVAFNRSKWNDALQAAEQGLSIAPENEICAHLRAMALVKLGRAPEATTAIRASLERNPESGFAHANQGWALIEQGRYAEAQEHFREALRLDPELEWARQGILTALKARSRIYRLALGFFLWMSKWSSGAQWAIIIGLFVGVRVVRAIGKQAPSLQPVATVVVILYVGFVLLTWLADPFFNLLLRLHPLGRYALSRDERRGATLVGLCLVLGFMALLPILLVLLLAVFNHDPLGLTDPVRREALKPFFSALLLFAVGVFACTIPCSIIYRCRTGWPRLVMAAYAIAMLLMLLAMALAEITRSDVGESLVGFFIVAFIGSFWVGNVLASVKSSAR